MTEGEDLEKHLTTAESVISIVDTVSKGGRKTAEMINIWKPVWSKFDALIKLSEKIAEIHPYAKIAAIVLLSAYNIWKAQKARDQDMFELLNTIYELCNFVHDAAPMGIVPAQHSMLQKIMEQIIDCSQFISSYCNDHSFALRAVKHIFTGVDDAIIKYNASFESLKLAFTQRATLSTQVAVINLAASLADLHLDVNLNDMPYAEGARYKSGKGCILGTRVTILDTIIHWAFQEDPKSHICLLMGPAGSGKSAIAHSIARIFAGLGRLGSSFCFVRGDSGRRLELYFPTLARDLAQRDPHIKQALGHIIEDCSLRKTDDISDQFEEFICKAVSECSILGPILLVIDALDECGDGQARNNFLKLLSNQALMKKIPPNFRIFITSRPDIDVKAIFNHVHILQLHEQNQEETDQDILTFVHCALLTNPQPTLIGINEDHCLKVTQKSEGLFQWASVACQIVQEAAGEGQAPTYALEQVLSSGSGLYSLYKTALNTRFKSIKDPIFNKQFKTVLGFVLTVYKPLQRSALSILWKLAYGENGPTNSMDLILPHLAALFYGTSDSDTGVSPIHTSVLDFFTSPNCAGDFYININDYHFKLSMALLHVLNRELCFNICQIQTSYCRNAENDGLKEAIESRISPQLSYACQFLGTHLQDLQLSILGDHSEILGQQLKIFVEKRLLFWLEVLGWLKRTDCALECLLAIEQLTQFDMKLAKIARDVMHFVRMTSAVIEEATPHLYLSALIFVPQNTSFFTSFSENLNQRAKVLAGLEGKWPAMELTLTGHQAGINSVSFSPDREKVVSGSSDQTIRIWNAHTGELVSGPFQGHTGRVSSVAFSPDGERVVSGSDDQTIRIWNARTGEHVCGPFQGHTDSVRSIAFSPDGERVVSGSSDQTIRIWNSHTGELVTGPFQGHTDWVGSVAFSPDGERVVSGSSDQTIQIWNACTGELVSGPFQGHTGWVRSVVFSPDGERVVSGSSDQTIRIWNSHTGELVSGPFQGHTGWVSSVAFSPDGESVVSGSSDQTIRIWNSHTGELVSGPFQGHTDLVRSIAFSPDGERVVSGSSDQTIRIWNSHTGELVSGLFQGHTSPVSSVAFSPDGERVVSGSYDQIIRIWSSHTGELVSRPFQGHIDSVLSVAFSPDGERVVSGSYDQTIRVWNSQTGELVSGPFQDHTGWVSSVAFSPDGERVVSGSDDQTIRIWNSHTGELVSEPFQGHTDSISSVAFSPDGERVVSGSYDQTIQIWNACTGELVSGPFQGHTDSVSSVAFSPDGERVVSGSYDQAIQIWNSHTGELVSGPFQGHTGWVSSVAFSPDGERVVSGSSDQTIRIWNSHTGEVVSGPFQGYTDLVSSVAFSPDGERVVSGSYDQTIRIWNSHTGELVPGPFQDHTDWILSVAFSSDGERVVSGSSDQTIRIWNSHTGEHVSGPFQGHTGWVNSVAFSPDGERVVSGSSDQTIWIWNSHTGELVTGPFHGHRDWVSSVAFSPDGERVVSGSSDQTIQIWNSHTGEPVSGPFQGHTCWDLEFSHRGACVWTIPRSHRPGQLSCILS
ncbi:hypothetical protein M422DRAFT_272569 [Sphaerobolus stellatus SS14]|uniref:NACHT domain-containing protein n=1 Tax=Sphaerobolus stellatus (strain SS14) TaxID=990650 RepID=A0A0C9UBB0_SPHS4|nr:hypothetical protein M422DRAFT_272569 [Sphaerobolus stellatus SS14]